MKIQQMLTLDVYETNRSLEQLSDVFNNCNLSEFLYDNNCELFGFRTTDKSTMQHIIDNSKFDGRININLVDVLEINF